MKYVLLCLVVLAALVGCQTQEPVSTSSAPVPVTLFVGEPPIQPTVKYVLIEITNTISWPDPFVLEGADLFDVEIINLHDEEVFFHISPIGAEGVIHQAHSARALMGAGSYVLQINDFPADE